MSDHESGSKHIPEKNSLHVSTPWQYYLGSACPQLAVVLLLLVLAFLAQIVESDTPRLPLRDFLPLQGFPEQIDIGAATQIAEAGLKWLALTYFYWLVGLFTLGYCIFQLQRAFAACSLPKRATGYSVFTLLMLVTIAVLLYTVMVREVPLMSFIHLLRNLQMVSAGLLDLATWNTALAYVDVVAILAMISLLLVPGVHGGDPTRQTRAITRIMYCAAAFLLVWIAEATEMYRLAASLLQDSQREQVLLLAPTISLVVGVFASLLLAASYLAACLWLQWFYLHLHKTDPSHPLPVADFTPRRFLREHWPKITAVLMPLLPGVYSTVFGVLAQPL